MNLIINAMVLGIFMAPVTLEAAKTEGYLMNADIELFYKQGFVIKKQCISQQEIEQLRKQIDAVIVQALDGIQQSDDQTVSEKDHMVYIDESRIVYKRRPDLSISIGRINGVGSMQPQLLTTMRSEKMVRTFFELLNTSDLEHIICQLHPKMPGDGIAFPKHRDIQFRKMFDPEWQDILGNGSYAICIIPIDRMTKENGGLWIDKNNYPEDQGAPEDLIWIDAQPGDLIFMHPYVFHGSGPNCSSGSRKTILTGFCAFGANHKQYPGGAVNMRCTLAKGGTIAMEYAPWAEVQSTLDGNH